MGDEWLRGVSGGERRRTNIAMEMLKQPRILFLDEPTSGLDAHTAFSVVSTLHRFAPLSLRSTFSSRCLRRLALEGRTIILSIHQPRYAIFKLFHSLTILMHGQTVFHGLCSQSLPYFNSIGMKPDVLLKYRNFFCLLVAWNLTNNFKLHFRIPV